MKFRYYLPSIFMATASLAVAGNRPVEAAAKPRSVVYEQRHLYGVTAHVVTVNLNDPHIRVTVNLSAGGIGRSETMDSFVARLRPTAAITGTFFDTRTLLPVGDIVTRGRKVYAGPAGTGFAIAADNTVDLKPRRYGRTVDWSDYRTVLCAGPTLLKNGRNALFPIAEGYRDSNLFAERPRTAVGMTRQNKMLLVAVNKPIYLRNMRQIMKGLGAVDAIGLDGGSSSALYAHGKVIVQPARRLTNLLTVYRTVAPSRHVAQRLAGKPIVRMAGRKPAQPAKRKSIVVRHTRRVPPSKPQHPYKLALKSSMVVASRTR